MKIRDFIKSKLSEEFGNSMSVDRISQEDIPAVLDICVQVFSNVMRPNELRGYIKSEANWDLSVKATINGKIVGCYIFNEEPVIDVCKGEDVSRYKDLKGIQGVGLAVLPEYRGTGVGKKLRDYPLHLNYDYIWGQHLKGLHNIDNWVKFGRRIVGDCGNLYITLMDLKKNDISERVEKNHRFQNNNYNCGPTCVHMVADYLGIKHKGIKDIEKLCNCTSTTGTIDSGIKSALESLGIRHEQNTKNLEPESAMKYLNDSLVDGNVFIMRTLTQGIKHWIIVYKFDGEFYYIADPWLGKITYSPDQILNIWQPRNFDGFIVFK